MKKVFYNGRIITMDSGCPRAEALLVEGNKISRVGNSEDMLSLAEKSAERYDLEGKTVIPGLIDAHTHLFSYAMAKNLLDLSDMNSFGQALSLIKERADNCKKGEWIVGRGWDQNRMRGFNGSVIGKLDKIFPENPVFLERVCGHAALVNSAALGKGSIESAAADPAGGEIKRDPAGRPTGLLIDKAADIIRRIIPRITPEKEKELVGEAVNDCLAAGVTCVHDMSVNPESAAVYRELQEQRRFPFRLYGYYLEDKIDFDNIADNDLLPEGGDENFSVQGVKFFTDGSLGARSAALLEDYSDDKGNRGILTEDPETLSEKILSCQRAGLQAAVHAIGDRANRVVLDIFEKVNLFSPVAGRRHRIEHAQIIAPEDIDRFHALSLIPSMQFVHCSSDMPWAESRIGFERLAGAYPWKSLVSSGCRIAGGSDMPVESINPFRGIYSAVTCRIRKGKRSKAGGDCDRRLSLPEALESFTLNAAYASFREDLLGSLKAGKFADFIIISDNILEMPVEEIPMTAVLGTVQNGNIVHNSADWPF
ncbi:MAG: amidohydrolase [Candidatus Krumholzibacteriota bacterium]|nr:amidohydrolase [Candidatus Krumholzibacteriota bacterium]